MAPKPHPRGTDTGATMNILSRLTHRIRATRIDQLRADRADIERAITDLERRQRAALNRRMARRGVMATRTRPPVPAFLRRAA